MDNDTEENEKLSLNSSNESHPLTARYQSNKTRKERKPFAKASMTVTVTKEPKKTSLMSVARLQVPNSGKYQRLDNSPLLKLESDSDDEDDLFLSYTRPTANQVNRQLTKQLEKDGYRLDEMPDDEELDLIPPREFREARFCSCCNAFNISCAIM
ncbi:protein FAM219A-like [Styela clava]